jgi:beta-glucosidase-like glycosyl hydrolase
MSKYLRFNAGYLRTIFQYRGFIVSDDGKTDELEAALA